MAIPSKHARPRALITGLRGFTGEYLARELEACGYEVFGTAFGNEAVDDHVFYVDLCDRDAVSELVNAIRPDIVAHLAAISFVPHGNIEDMYRINVVGSRNLLEALASMPHAPHCVLLASSSNVYGNVSVDAISETVEPLPGNDYAISKLAMEHVARLWQDKLPIVITRSFNYTGIGQGEHFLVPKIVKHFNAGARQIELGNIDIARDFSDVRTVAKIYSELLRVAPSGKTFNVCSGSAHTLRDIISMAQDLCGYKIDVQVNPMFVRENEIKKLVGSTSKLRKQIGDWRAIPLRDTLAWMLNKESVSAASVKLESCVTEILD